VKGGGDGGHSDGEEGGDYDGDNVTMIRGVMVVKWSWWRWINRWWRRTWWDSCDNNESWGNIGRSC